MTAQCQQDGDGSTQAWAGRGQCGRGVCKKTPEPPCCLLSHPLETKRQPTWAAGPPSHEAEAGWALRPHPGSAFSPSCSRLG